MTPDPPSASIPSDDAPLGSSRSLVLPFALVGAAAGWISVVFLANPFVGLACLGEEPLAAATTAIAGAALGAWLERSVARTAAGPFPDPRAGRRLVMGALVAGAASGATAGAIEFRAAGAAFVGLLSGIGCAVAFLPVAALVVAAAARAARARMGSIVAASDRRAVWSILAVTLAAATLVTLPAWPASVDAGMDPPTALLGLATVATVAAVAALAWDIAASSKLERVAREAALFDDGAGLDVRGADRAVPRLDLGLGGEVRARFAAGPVAYRSRPRVVALLLGDADIARDALRRAVRRGTVGVAVTVLTLLGHTAARTNEARIAFDEARCGGGNPHGCRAAALLLEAAGRESGSARTMARARALHARACAARYLMSCDAVEDIDAILARR